MLRNFLKNRKAQNTAEYALLIALVVAGVLAMQTWAQRAMQARIHDAGVYMANNGGSNVIGNSTQYEPYYLTSNYDVKSNSEDIQRQGAGTFGSQSDSNRIRSGGETTSYNADTDMNSTK